MGRYLAKYESVAPDLNAEFLRAHLIFEVTPERAFAIIEREDEFSAPPAGPSPPPRKANRAGAELSHGRGTGPRTLGSIGAPRARLGINDPRGSRPQSLDQGLGGIATLGSEQSVLGATYAERHQERARAIVLAAVSTGTAADIEWLTVAMARYFPAEWRAFRDHVPAELRHLRHLRVLDDEGHGGETMAQHWCRMLAEYA